MKTIMDEARTNYASGKINGKFDQFSKDYQFILKPCVAGRPSSKGKVETQMKLLDEIHAYQGKLTFEKSNEKNTTNQFKKKYGYSFRHRKKYYNIIEYRKVL